MWENTIAAEESVYLSENVWPKMIYAAIFLIGLILAYVFRNFRRPENFPPGPEGLRFIGNVPLIKRLSREKGGLHLAFSSLAEQFKTSILGLQLGSDLVVVVFSEDNLAAVHLDEVFNARPNDFFSRLRTFGVCKGVTFTDGDLWLEHHKFALKHLHQLGFGKVKVKNLIKEEISHFVKLLNNQRDDVCITKYLARLVLNVLWTVVAGTRFSLDDPKLGRLLELMNSRSKAFDFSGGLLNRFPWMRFLAPDKSGYKLISNLNSELRNFLMDEIEKHKGTRTDEVRDFMDLYLEKIDAPGTDKGIFNEDQLVAVCLDFFIAGSHTTSDTLGFALLAMTRYPDVQAKVQRCLDAAVLPGTAPDFTEEKGMNYVSAVLLEAMRSCFVAPTSGPRRATRTTTVGGYTIPQGTTVLMSIHSILNDKKRWSDPEMFRPERFLDNDGNITNSDRLYFFGRGKRRCIGEALARNFIFQFFTSLLYHFEFSAIPDKPLPTTPVAGIFLSPQPFHVNLRPRISKQIAEPGSRFLHPVLTAEIGLGEYSTLHRR
ncbi:probable cytochrome P450 305a1 isoform X2 [Bemisia tabaci]|uniref:probable cytochrome P450 305a1 isoform X2 n=1 Tax=Bemisia tabaci TaxID=7038 RepID=UPI003B27BE99